MDYRSRTYGVSEALDIRSQDRILDMRGSLDSLKHICVVCHLHRGAKNVGYRLANNVLSDRKSDADDSNPVDKIFIVKADMGPTNGEFPLGLCRPGKEKTYYLRNPLGRDKTGGLDHRQT